MNSFEVFEPEEEMEEEKDERNTVKGTVAYVDGKKGYGLVEPDEGEGSFFFYLKDVKFGTVEEGDDVAFGPDPDREAASEVWKI